MNDAAQADIAPRLASWSLKDAPFFIERQFPVGRLSAEAYKERKAGSGQTLTALGSYWKGRKPLILVRAVVLGCLLPATEDAAADLDIFLKLMAMDDAAFGRRFDGSATTFARLFPDLAETVATRATRAWRMDLPIEVLKERAIAVRPASNEPDHLERFIIDDLTTFAKSARTKKPTVSASEFASVFPHFADGLTQDVVTNWHWRNDLDERERQARVALAFAGLPYAERLGHVRRPEECDEAELLAPIWREVNSHLGTTARTLPDLVEQLGIAQFGHRPKLADTFCGGGSIPFEAARLGCDVYASDLNPIACMLTWGAFNIIGAPKAKRVEIEQADKKVTAAVDAEITRLGIEYDAQGNRAKAYLYCLETRCPKTGWMVPMAQSWIISKTSNVIAKLVPDHSGKRYNIEIHSGVSPEEMAEAEVGTVLDGRLVHQMNPERSGVEIRTIRGDYRDAEGNNRNRLRLWEKADFIPQPDDIFQERLYCIQWITKASLSKRRQVTFFAAVKDDDLARERKVEEIVYENLARWQEDGLVPDLRIEPGEKTDEPIRTRGWTHWHHLFGARQLHMLALGRKGLSSYRALLLANDINFNAKLCGIHSRSANSGREMCLDRVFINQALNTLINYGVRSFAYSADNSENIPELTLPIVAFAVAPRAANLHDVVCDAYVTDPPYADAVYYHEITEFFIAWLRKDLPQPFDQWVWESHRDLAIKGRDEDFRRDMVAAYAAMTRHMPDNGLQVVMFTHQDAGVWADLGSILWAAGLRVTAAWNIVTETESALKAGNYVQGTVCLVLRKRLAEANARRMEIEAEIEEAVAAQLGRLAALDDSWHERTNAETLYTDGDLTLAAYAAALQVVTAYSSIDRQPLDRDLYRKLGKNERTMLRDLIDYAAQVANGLLVPTGFPRDMWRDLGPPERFYVRMLDMEANGSAKVADFQNFARSFAFGGYDDLMASTVANAAALAGAVDLKGRMLSGEGFWGTQLRLVRNLEDDGGQSARPEAWRDHPQDRIRRGLLAASPEANRARSLCRAQDPTYPPRRKRSRRRTCRDAEARPGLIRGDRALFVAPRSTWAGVDGAADRRVPLFAHRRL
jgi:putative DNA methylase